jgi:hypothetical protein
MTGPQAAAWVLTVCTTLRLSQTKTLAYLVAAALHVGRVSLADLGRKLVGAHAVKHKPTDRASCSPLRPAAAGTTGQ